MKYSTIGLLTIALGLVTAQLTAAVRAAERTRPMRIGVLTSSWGPSPQTVGLRDGLLALGYREDQEFVLGIRFTQGDLTALPAAARELVQYGVDLIFASQLFSAKAAQMATTRIPIVFAGGAGTGDPVEMGLVQSFARPGRNITGVTDLDLELGPKRLEVFREIIPALRCVLYLYDLNDSYAVALARTYRGAAHRLGLELVEQAVRTQEEAKAALAQVLKGEVDGLLPPASTSVNIPASSWRPRPGRRSQRCLGVHSLSSKAVSPATDRTSTKLAGRQHAWWTRS
jgi:putative ABC transport system substrate-binding protein